MDVLVPRIGELIVDRGEDRLDVLKERMAHHDLDEKDYWWYLNLREFGTVPHAGFGLGFERLVMYVTDYPTFVTSSHFQEHQSTLNFKLSKNHPHPKFRELLPCLL